MTGLVLLYLLIAFDVIGKERGLVWPAVLLYWYVVFSFGGLTFGVLGGVLAERRSRKQWERSNPPK